MPDRRRVAVVGGGITGLATAYFLQQAGVAVTLIEADDRLGGKIRTDALAGVPVEAGPDAFLARVPSAVELCRELGLGDALVAPATGTAFIWTGGRLRPRLHRLQQQPQRRVRAPHRRGHAGLRHLQHQA